MSQVPGDASKGVNGRSVASAPGAGPSSAVASGGDHGAVAAGVDSRAVASGGDHGAVPAVASVRLDSPLPHLDRPFDYAIPPKLIDVVTVGSRVRVPLAGRLVNAVVTDLLMQSEFSGKLSEIRSSSVTPSYTADAIDLAKRVARRCGGSVWDVLRLMAPPRVAAVEKRNWTEAAGSLDIEAKAKSALAELDEGITNGETQRDEATTNAEAPREEATTNAEAQRDDMDGGSHFSGGNTSPTSSIYGAPEGFAAPTATPIPPPSLTPIPPDTQSLSESTDSVVRLLTAPGDRVVWEAIPDTEPRTSIAALPLIRATLETVATGASAIVVVPDSRAMASLLGGFERLGFKRWTARSGGDIAMLDHDDGPSVRFGNYLAAMHGHARIVIGTRPTAMQPVPQLGLIAVWDEANGALEDPHAPYPHARTVAAMRAEEGASLILGGYALSAEAIALVEHGWARLHSSSRDHVRDTVPAIDVLTAERRDAEGGSGWHWMPGSAWRALRAAVADGPVAIVVPRAGYVRATACARCEAWAECRECSSLLSLPSPGADPVCQEQGHAQVDWHCPECQGNTLKHVRQGAERIAEQLQRMLRDTPLTVSSAAAGIVPDHQVSAGVVLATPAALPAVVGGYRHLVILDAGVPASLGLGGELKAIRWWLNAAALVRSRRNGGAVTIVGELPPAVRRALASWTPADAARAEYATRGEISLPPHRRYLTVHGAPDAVSHALELAGLRDPKLASPSAPGAVPLPVSGTPAITEIVLDGGVGVLIPRSRAQSAVDSLRESVQAASRAGGDLRLRVDGPLELPR